MYRRAKSGHSNCIKGQRNDEGGGAMRDKLKPLETIQTLYIATIKRRGLRKEGHTNVSTVCLDDVQSASGEHLTDHLWVDVTDEWSTVTLTEGTCLVLLGTCQKYQRGYLGQTPKKETATTWDYGLTDTVPLIAFHPQEIWDK